MNNVWEVPEPLSTCEVQLDDDTITILRRHGNPAGPRLVLSHGNGLASDLYYPFWSLLAEDFDLVIFDLRNHGWNTIGPRANHNVPTLVRDHLCIFEAIDQHYGNKPKTGIFHSASALITLLSLTTMADLGPSDQSNHFSTMILFDPPLCKPGNSQIEFDEAAEYAAEVTRRRGYLFQTEEDFSELLSFLPGFSRLVPGVRELMARTTLRKAADGQGFELRCPRDYEAQIVDYMRSFSAQIFRSFRIRPTHSDHRYGLPISRRAGHLCLLATAQSRRECRQRRNPGFRHRALGPALSRRHSAERRLPFWRLR